MPSIRFEELELDLERGTLRHITSGPIPLSRLSRRLLCYLAENRDRVVPFEEVRDEVWEGVHVSEAAVHQALRQLRRALADDGRKQKIIKTVRGAGYRFVAPASGESADRLDENASAHYVGRASLLAELHRQLEAALGGNSRLILLGGAPGVGKSRTAEELVRTARGRGAVVLRGISAAQRGAPPYWPWPSLFTALSRQRPLAGLRREIEDIAPSFLDPERAGSDSASLDEVKRFRLFDAAAHCLERATGLGPLAVWLDDLHEMAPATLDLLEHVLRKLADAPLFVVCAYRDAQTASPGPFAERLGRLAGLPNASSFEVGPLDDAETASLIERLDPPTRADWFVEQLSRRTKGNPFYLVELIRYLASTAGAADPGSIDWLERIPRGIEHVLSARLAALSDGTRRVLSRAACLGMAFDLRLLERLESPTEVAAALAEARSLGMLRGRADAPQFSHPLLREAIVSHELHDPEARRRSHLEIAEAYAEKAPERVAEAAYHFAEAAPLGGLERTVGSLMRAAERAERLFDDDEARALYQRAIRLMDETPWADDGLRCELLVAAGELVVRGLWADEARGMLREAIAIARYRDEPELFCRGVLGLAYRDEILGVAEEDVAELIEEALAYQSTADPRLRVRLLSALALKIRYQPGALARALGLIEESVELAKAVGDAGALARALEDASFVRWSVEAPEGWIELNHQIIEAASQARDTALLFRGVKGLATGFLEIGDRDAAEREIARCDALARSCPTPYFDAIRSLQLGGLAMLDGRFDAGEGHAIAAAQSGLPAVTPLAAVQIYYHRLETARISELEASLRSLVEGSPGIGAWRYALARLLSELGRLDEAAEQLALAGPLATLPRDRNWLAAGTMGTGAALLMGDLARCAALFEALAPYARVNVVLGHGSLFFGNAAHFLGILAHALGRLDDADRQLRAALSMHRRMRSPAWVLHTRVALALTARGTASSRADAALMSELYAEAESLGMTALAARISAPA